MRSFLSVYAHSSLSVIAIISYIYYFRDTRAHSAIARTPRPWQSRIRNSREIQKGGGEELQQYGLDCHAALAMTEVTELQQYGLDCHAALAMTEVTELQQYGLDCRTPLAMTEVAEIQQCGLDCHAALAMTEKGKTENDLIITRRESGSTALVMTDNRSGDEESKQLRRNGKRIVIARTPRPWQSRIRNSRGS